MSVSLTLERHLVAVEPSEVVTVKPTAAPRFSKPTGGPLFTLDPAVVATARELEALVDGARRLVTVDPAWALWALECAVAEEYLQDLDDDETLKTAMSLLTAGVDELYRAERRLPALYRPPRIDRGRLDVAMSRIGHLGKPAFRARIADAYDDASVAVA
jgi:hypothetical protein